MPDLGERSVCSEKIFVPPSFPSIMKGYCKAAIRTQPYDLLTWSAAYFRALANGENPPAKERLEFPPTIYPPGLTPGYLKALVNLLGKTPSTVTSEEVSKKWAALCLPPSALQPLLSLLQAPVFPWLHFLAVAAGSICSSLTQTMILICDTLTNDPDGGRVAIPIDIFLELYEFLAYLDCEYAVSANRETTDEQGSMIQVDMPGIGPKLPENQVAAVMEFMLLWSGRQEGLIMPRNIRHWMCPPLDNATLIL